jgi:uridylate kinase
MALQDMLERKGVETRVMTAIRMEELAEPYIRRRASGTWRRGGSCSLREAPETPTSPPTPRPFCGPSRWTRTSSSRPPRSRGLHGRSEKDPDATFLPTISFQEVVAAGAGRHGCSAVSLCKENGLPIIVLDLGDPGVIGAAIRGEAVGTLVS